jgi:CDP-diacylglycerol--serine O-phosphatidyltransferase
VRFRRRRPGPKRTVRYVAILPTLMTLGNAVCGILALFHLLKRPGHDPDPLTAAWLILVALIFDGLDGKVARATRSTSNFGAQLDSLSDAVTFGVAPAVLVLQLVSAEVDLTPFAYKSLAACAVIYGCCALIRLARFNVESAKDESHDSFFGLPSPGAAGLLAAATITYEALGREAAWSPLAMFLILYGIPAMTFFAAILMVSRIRYPHMLNRVLRGFRPFTTLIEIVIAGVLIFVLHQMAIFVGFLVYVGSGPVLSVQRLLFPKSRPESEEARDESVH